MADINANALVIVMNEGTQFIPAVVLQIYIG